MRMRRGGAALAAAALALTLGACGVIAGDTETLTDADTLVIGVKADEPGLGKRQRDGDFTGFDVAVARYVAHDLGFDAEHVRFTAITSADRESDLAQGKVDLVVASYSITPERGTKVSFAGPYYVAHQDIMVRGADDSIHDVHDLAGRRLCKVAGSDSWKRVINERKVVAEPVPARSYGQCADLLASGKVDAVSTDDLILAGLAARNPELKILNAPFSNEKYGIGIKKDDVQGCAAVNQVVTQMYQDATAQILLADWFGKTGLHTTDTVPQFAGCT